MPTSRYAWLAAASIATVAVPSLAQYSTPMRDVENPDRSAFMVNANGSLEPPFVNGFVQVPTPAGKRYFIEYVTLNCTLNSTSDSITQVLLSTRQNISNGSLGFSSAPLALERRGNAAFGGVSWTGSAMVKMFSDPDVFTAGGGTAITFNVFHSESASRGSCSAFVSGHTLPL